ncbi:MAG: hypothetical protein DI537_34115 [Stutzerimonas stutzeri]|nr:MAG: hypothetical protein DI537_34115 [Stutzerimonas stutzeri]
MKTVLLGCVARPKPRRQKPEVSMPTFKLLQLSEDLIDAFFVFIGSCLIPSGLGRQSRNGIVACIRLDPSSLEPCAR